MKRRCDAERRALNAIESEMWTSDPEFYRQFGRAWSTPAGPPVAPRRRPVFGLWLLPVGLILSGCLLSVVLVSSR
ncbi:MAG: DUF3040 domain-containing protein [Sporichthyaceae bacterium]|jgi:hypothetical protein